jgi:hypothetical protein
MSLLLVHVSRDPLCTYPSTLCVYHPPNSNDPTLKSRVGRPSLTRDPESDRVRPPAGTLDPAFGDV